MAYRGSRGTCYVYELVDDGGSPHLPGLTDPATLIGCDYDSHRVVAGDDFEAPGRQFEPTSSPRRAPVEPSSSPTLSRAPRRGRQPREAAAALPAIRRSGRPGQPARPVRAVLQMARCPELQPAHHHRLREPAAGLRGLGW